MEKMENWDHLVVAVDATGHLIIPVLGNEMYICIFTSEEAVKVFVNSGEVPNFDRTVPISETLDSLDSLTNKYPNAIIAFDPVIVGAGMDFWAPSLCKNLGIVPGGKYLEEESPDSESLTSRETLEILDILRKKKKKKKTD